MPSILLPAYCTIIFQELVIKKLDGSTHVSCLIATGEIILGGK